MNFVCMRYACVNITSTPTIIAVALVVSSSLTLTITMADSSPRIPARPAGRPVPKPAPRSTQQPPPPRDQPTEIPLHPAPPSNISEQLPSYDQEVYLSSAWVPLRRDPEAGNRPLSTTSDQLKRQSGLNQLVIERRGSQAIQDDPKVSQCY